MNSYSLYKILVLVILHRKQGCDKKGMWYVVCDVYMFKNLTFADVYLSHTHV